MIRIGYILIISLLACKIGITQNICCPDFELRADMQACKPKPKYVQGGPINERPDSCDVMACKHTTHLYSVYPMIPGFTYNWQVSGGVASPVAINSIHVTWGTADMGLIKVIISNADGSCRDTITKRVCLTEAPTASFTSSPITVCMNGPVQFTNTSVNANSYYWDFGDGSSSSDVNPSHNFSTPGNYTVLLTAFAKDTSRLEQESCGCWDTASIRIIVKDAEALKIIPSCKQMLCFGDTTDYCISANCNSYNWTVTGGRILGSSTNKCVKVIWDGSYPAVVNFTGNCGNACGNVATYNAPVLFPTMPINGPSPVCPSSFASYSLPSMPGTFYTWTLSGGGAFIGPDINTSEVSISWFTNPGTYTLTCNYQNPVTKCNGTASKIISVLLPYKITGPFRFCVGDGFLFSATGPGSWSINPNSGFSPSSFAAGSSISGVWNAPGLYTITATPTTPSNYCSSPGVQDVIVFDKPLLNPVIGPLQICPGSSHVYSAGSNINGGLFNWSVNGGTVISIMGDHKDSIMVTWTGPTYSLSVYQTVEGCSSNIQTINISLFPPPIVTGIQTACMDGTLTYTATGSAPPGGFTWSIGNALGTIMTGQGTNVITVQWHGSTVNNLTSSVIVSTCAGNSTLPITISTPASLTINPSGNLCSTSGLTLTASISPATLYAWTFNGNAIGGNTQSINATMPGTYSVTVTANGCKSTATFLVAPQSTFTASISATNNLLWYCNVPVSTNFIALPSGSYCYQWFRVPGTTPIATTQNYTATLAGQYYCIVSICGTGCQSVSDTLTVIREACDPSQGSCDNNYTFLVTPSGCNPVNFISTANPAAAGPPTIYFGDNSLPATSNNVTHSYLHIGTFPVQAIFGGNGYCRKDTSFLITIPLAANFLASVNCNKLTLTNLSEAVSPGYSISWTLTGSSSPSSILTNPVVTYASSGTYLVQLTITQIVNGQPCSSTYSENIVITIPSTSISVPTTVCALSNAPFIATGQPGWQYAWSFGDSFTSGLQNTHHAYAAAGTFPVILTVTDANGCTATAQTSITVSPPLIINIGPDQSICPGTVATFIATPPGAYTYKWFKDGVQIPSATSSSYSSGIAGEYWVEVSNGPGCIGISNHAKILLKSMPVADIIGNKLACKSTGNAFFILKNAFNETGVTYLWSSITGPGPVTFTPVNSFNTTATAALIGNYQIQIKATLGGCVAYDTICISVVQGLTVTMTGPTGSLCEGTVYNFVATAAPASGTYFYKWNNGISGNTLSTGMPGFYYVTATNEYGCAANAPGFNIAKRPDLSLFPIGCDTLCVTDTLKIPLPVSSQNTWPYTSSNYTVTWYEAGSPVGTGFTLPLANIQPGDHHLYAVVKFNNMCSDTSGTFDLYVKDCNLPPPCDNCPSIIQSFSVTQPSPSNTVSSGYTIYNTVINITTLKPVRELRVSLMDLQYHWSDSTCNDCKLDPIERGCIYPAIPNQMIGSLSWNNPQGISFPITGNTECPNEISWSSNTLLPPGTYSIPIQFTLASNADDKCKIIIDKLCIHLTAMDNECKLCDINSCATEISDECKCNPGNNWTSLYLVPTSPGVPIQRNQILCGTTLSGYTINTPYNLSGVYQCTGGCLATNNSIQVKNAQGDIIYTRVAMVLNENFQFPADGLYTITLSSNCGTKKCDCIFKIKIDNTTEPPFDPPLPLDSLVTTILPPDFTGSVLIAQGDKIFTEKHFKVDNKTSFDIASISKTFTGMAILKLFEEGKINLDDDIQKYLPSFPIKGITVKMLLTHKSGLDDYVTFMQTSGWDKTKNMTNSQLLTYIVEHKSAVQKNQPGQVFDYSNTNFALLALIIEKISGQTYPQFMKAKIFTPLEMNDTYVFREEDFPRATKSYYKNGKPYTLKFLDLIYGDKNIYSSARDMLKWDRALRTNTFLKKETLTLAYTPALTPEPYKSNYGLGWRLMFAPNGKKLVYHNGWWHGNRSVFIRMLDENAVIIILSNNNFTTISEARKLTDLFGKYNQTNSNFINF